MKLGIEELSIIVEGLRLRVKQLSSSVTEINQSIENLETEDGTKAPAIMQTTSPAAIATFSDGGEDMPIKSLKCTIVPVQAGTGDPAPDNIRPITGWNGVTVTRSGTDPADTESHTITFPQTVYGGWIDVISGELHIDRAFITITDFTQWSYQSDTNYVALYRNIAQMGLPLPDTDADARKNAICSVLNYRVSTSGAPYGTFTLTSSGALYLWNNDLVYANAAEMKQALTELTPQFCYYLAEPVVYQLDPVTINTLLGNNSISCDTGTVEVKYSADTKMYIDNAIAAVTPEPEPEPEQDEAPPEEEEVPAEEEESIDDRIEELVSDETTEEPAEEEHAEEPEPVKRSTRKK